MANTIVHPTKTLDAIECFDAAEVLAAIEQMGMSLVLSRPVEVRLIEETLSDGSTAQSIAIVAASGARR